jgi:hypothetical protein
LDPPQPEDAATSARVTTPQPKIRTARAIVMRTVSLCRPHQDIALMG